MSFKDFNQLVDYAVALHKKGNYKNAQKCYQRALILQPNNSYLLRLYGTSFFQQGNFKNAIKLYNRSVAIQPSNADTWRHLGIVLRETGQHQEAIEAYQKAITYRRHYPEAFCNLGNVFSDLNRDEEAIAAYQEALRLKPDYADAYTNMGSAFEKLNQIDEAIIAHQKALDILPSCVPAYNNMGQAFLRKGQFKKAIKLFRKAVQIKPDYAIGWSNLGVALSALNKINDAERALKKAYILGKRSILCKRNLAIFFQQIGKYDDALRVYEELVTLQPGVIDPYFNIAELYNAKGEYQLALNSFRDGILNDPNNSNAHFALALNLLKHGQYEEGFVEYEWRRNNNYINREYSHSQEWQGEDLSGKTILLYPEQGLGDMIQFIRFADVLHKKGANLLLETYPCLQNIFSNSFPHLFLCSPDIIPSQKFQYYTPLMSIPKKLKLALKDISGAAYLTPTPEKTDQWQPFLNKNTFNIGIAWQGNPAGEIDRGRSIPVHFFQLLADIDLVQLYNLQKNWGLDQINELSKELNIIHMPEHFDSGEDAFVDSLALMQHLDLIITSDTSIAHIGGALGCPTWVALKHNPDWRWGMSGEKSYWYDSVRLFRQKKIGDWGSLFVEIAAAIRVLLPSTVS